MALHILGIRHHGVGSAFNVKARLEELKPDIILVEGPPEISEMFSLAGKEGLVPPAAIMVYDPAQPRESVFYPFAEYSPEWVAILFANQNNIPVRALDLPFVISSARRAAMKEAENTEDKSLTPINEEKELSSEILPPQKDPLSVLAQTDGYSSGEEWWEYHFEQQKNNAAEHFEAVMYVMKALREDGLKSALDEDNVYREAYMRTLIRQAQNELYSNIAVICGAWHAPALEELDKTSKSDIKILKELPKSKVKATATWIPWTNSRLSMFSGYGAGIYSPGWYEHQWKTRNNTEIVWLTKVAKSLRKKGIDISTAHIMESYILCRSLASLRNHYFVSLDELNEACLSVMCMGDNILLEWIKKEIVVGNKLGKVPDELPKVPLQEDFEQKIKSLKLKLTADPKQYDLDLRKDLDLQRSIFFYQLEIVGITWCKRTVSRTKGTFKESWRTEWSPDMMMELIDKAFLGNTIEQAAQNIIAARCAQTNSITEITELLQLCIPSEIFSGIDLLLERIIELSTLSSDIIDLLKAIPGLVEVSRYGNVRNSDLSVLNNIVQQLLVKVYVGLGNACYGLDEENSNLMFSLISMLNNAVRLYNDDTYLEQWNNTLHKLIDKQGVHSIIIGCVCRLLLDAGCFNDQEADTRISFALSSTGNHYNVASWLEGFLKGNGMILIYDNRLWNLVYAWVTTLHGDTFMELLPLLRRTFSRFEYGERKQIGIKAKKGLASENLSQGTTSSDIFDEERAVTIIPVIKQLCGIN